MTQSLHLGPLELTLILDARGGIEEGDRIFYPATREEWSARLDSDPQGNVPVVVNALLISEGDQHTLVDTGFGEEERSEREENVLDSLAQVGVQPKHIGRVILTHAHGDHCLGNTLRRAGRWLPTFPLAEYVIQEREIAAMRELGDEIWHTRFEPLAERGQLRLIDSSTELSETLACWPTPGHTIGHQSVLIRANEKRALFVGDLAVLAGNLEHLEWGPSWAWSREADLESRRIVARWAADNKAILILGHDPKYPWVTLEHAGEGYRVLPFEP